MRLNLADDNAGPEMCGTQTEGIETVPDTKGRIYERTPEGSRPSRPCRDLTAAPASSVMTVAQTMPVAMHATSTPDVDAKVIAILRASDNPAETIEVRFRRKELALQALFISLSAATARDLHRRLSRSPRDEMSILFGRLVAERRSRLLAVLADAPRRDALKRAGRLR